MAKKWYENAKNLFKSKTFWVNLVALVAYGAKKYGGVEEVPDPLVDSGLLAIANIILRLVTKQPVTV
jgi:hypothetical protein